MQNFLSGFSGKKTLAKSFITHECSWQGFRVKISDNSSSEIAAANTSSSAASFAPCANRPSTCANRRAYFSRRKANCANRALSCSRSFFTCSNSPRICAHREEFCAHRFHTCANRFETCDGVPAPFLQRSHFITRHLWQIRGYPASATPPSGMVGAGHTRPRPKFWQQEHKKQRKDL